MNVMCPHCGVELGVLEPLDRDTVVHRPCQACSPAVAGRPSRLVYVDRRQPELYRELVEEYRDNPAVLVLFDRRATDRRRLDRRAAERQAASDRRATAERRTRQEGIVVHGRPTP